MKPTFAIHSYPWYMADWHNSETRIALSMAERGLYRELLDHCYTEGSIPDDEKKLSAIAGCTINEIRRLWPQVKQCFSSNGVSGRLEHKRVNQVLEKLENWNKSRQKGGHQRHVKGSAKAYENGALADTATSGTSSSSTTTSTTTLLENPQAPAADAAELEPPAPKRKREPSAMDSRIREAAEELSAEHPNQERTLRPEDADTALRAILKTVPIIERVLLLEAILKRHRAKRDRWSAEPQYCPKLKNWLKVKDGEWKLEPQPQTMAVVVTNGQSHQQLTFAERNEEIRNRKFMERMAEDLSNG